jgi:HNH endonuclease
MKSSWPDWEVYKNCYVPGVGWKCPYCGFTANDYLTWRQLGIDHVIPTIKRGDNCSKNKVVVCKRCNEMKGVFDPRPAGQSEAFPSSDKVRQEYFEAVRQFLDLENCEEKKDFDLMMREFLGSVG